MIIDRMHKSEKDWNHFSAQSQDCWQKAGDLIHTVSYQHVFVDYIDQSVRNLFSAIDIICTVRVKRILNDTWFVKPVDSKAHFLMFF